MQSNRPIKYLKKKTPKTYRSHHNIFIKIYKRNVGIPTSFDTVASVVIVTPLMKSQKLYFDTKIAITTLNKQRNTDIPNILFILGMSFQIEMTLGVSDVNAIRFLLLLSH